MYVASLVRGCVDSRSIDDTTPLIASNRFALVSSAAILPAKCSSSTALQGPIESPRDWLILQLSLAILLPEACLWLVQCTYNFAVSTIMSM